MLYVAVGAASFGFIALFELASLERIAHVKPVFGALACLPILYASIMMLLDTPRLALPTYVSVLGGFFLLVSGFLMIYSMFLEIPFRKTYVSEGSGDTLIKTGTYALVRHPVVLWLAIFLGSLVLVSRSQLFLIAAPVWLTFDAIYVYFEERLYLGKVFQGYAEYQRETPMLVPTPGSFRRCLQTLRWPSQRRHKWTTR